MRSKPLLVVAALLGGMGCALDRGARKETAEAAPPAFLGPRDIDALPSRPADVREAYGSDPLQFGELRLPPGKGPFPVAVVIHGGCWLSAFANLQNTAALSDALRDAGIATWNIEYRRTDNPGGGWPGTFTDVATATDHLRALATRHPLDLSRVVSVGHSAGGSLALWLAGRPRIPAGSALHRVDPLRLVAAIDLAGPPDMKDFARRDETICGSPVLDPLFGGTPETVPEHYAHGSPAELLPLNVPHILVVGDADPVVPEGDRAAYAKRAGGEVEVLVLPSTGHFEPISPRSTAWPVVRDRILRLALYWPSP